MSTCWRVRLESKLMTKKAVASAMPASGCRGHTEWLFPSGRFSGKGHISPLRSQKDAWEMRIIKASSALCWLISNQFKNRTSPCLIFSDNNGLKPKTKHAKLSDLVTCIFCLKLKGLWKHRLQGVKWLWHATTVDFSATIIHAESKILEKLLV